MGASAGQESGGQTRQLQEAEVARLSGDGGFGGSQEADARKDLLMTGPAGSGRRHGGVDRDTQGGAWALGGW